MTALSVVSVPLQATADGDSVPALSVDDLTLQEPYPGTTATALFTITLDRPSSDSVLVRYRTWTDHINETVIDEHVMPPGETSFQVPVTVFHTDSPYSYVVRFELFAPVGATLAKYIGLATVVNIDKAGDFECSAMGERLFLLKTLPGGGTDTRYGELAPTSPCQDREAVTGRFSYTTPSGKGVKPVTITVTPSDVTTRGEPLPSPGFPGPFVGDGASARAVDYDVLISEPGGKRIQIEGLWGEVSTHCRALGAPPDLVTNGGASGLIVNGKRSKDLPDVINLGAAGTVQLGVVERHTGNPDNYYYGFIHRTLLQLNFHFGYLQLGYIDVEFSGFPCQT